MLKIHTMLARLYKDDRTEELYNLVMGYLEYHCEILESAKAVLNGLTSAGASLLIEQ